jgi:hypothetical protein
MVNNVKVDLNVSIDASGNVEVFGQAEPTVSNLVVCAQTLPVTDLYVSDAANQSLIKFWEPSGALGDISGAVVTAFAISKATAFTTDLNAVVNGSMDASGATPFNDAGAGYTSTSQYYTHSSFGRLALSAYAHYLFGHVAATAAITNDAAFISAMNGEGATDAKLASRLVTALSSKDAAAITAIVKQVIGQDAERAMGQDNNKLAPDVQQNLKFYAGDIIYMNINLKAPVVSVLNNEAAQLGEPAASAFTSDISYTLQITLGA